MYQKKSMLLEHFHKWSKWENDQAQLDPHYKGREGRKSAVGMSFMNACDKPLSGPDWHLSFTSSRIKINQSSGQHGELRTAESPLKTLSAGSGFV